MNKEFIIECAKNNRKIEAIEYVRTETGLGIKQAIEYVENVIEEFNEETVSHQERIFDDEFFEPAVELILSKGQASVSMIQRTFNISYNRASKLIDMMGEFGIISAQNGSNPRKVLILKSEWILLKHKLKQNPRIIPKNMLKKEG